MENPKILKKELFYNNQKVKCLLTKYTGTTNNAIIMVNNKEEEVAVCSVNFDFQLKKNEVFIDNSSKNRGMLDFLVNNNIVKMPKKCINSGFNMIPICELVMDM